MTTSDVAADYTDCVRQTGLGFGDFTDVQANTVDTAAGGVITLAGEGTLTFSSITLASSTRMILFSADKHLMQSKPKSPAKVRAFEFEIEEIDQAISR